MLPIPLKEHEEEENEIRVLEEDRFEDGERVE